MRPLSWARFLIGAMILLPLRVDADPVGYAVAFNTLYRVDLGTRQATEVGPVGYNDVDGLAFSKDGVLYGLADATAGTGGATSDFLVRIDLNSGRGNVVRSLTELSGTGPGGNLDYGLAFTCDGRLWMSSDSTGQFWEVTPGSGEIRFVANLGAPISGLAARGDQLYGIGVTLGAGSGNPAGQATYRINTETGEATRIGSLNVSDTLSGAGADFDANGVLWATLDSQPPDFDRPSRIARIDLTTGAATVTGSVLGVDDNISLRSLAIAPTGACEAPGGGSVGEPSEIPAGSRWQLALIALMIATLAVPVLRLRQNG